MSNQHDMLTPTQEGSRRIKYWEACETELERCRRDVNRALDEIKIAENQVVEWLIPKDAHVDEKFCIAIGSGFLQVWKGNDGFNHVTWRTRPYKD